MMPTELDKKTPTVVVYNISETFVGFLSRAKSYIDQEQLIHGEQYGGDRGLLWLGDSKLVFVSFPIPHAESLLRLLGYQSTIYSAPQSPSAYLSLDILREEQLLNRLIEYAGETRTIQLIPYATTREFFQLVEALQIRYGLNVMLPESPQLENLWLRDYVDTKAGFHLLISRWLANAGSLLPQAFACHDLTQVANVAYWFSLNNKACLIKANIGENGIGNVILLPHESSSMADTITKLKDNTFLDNDLIMVEEFISSTKMISPSLEIFVPSLGTGLPMVTYVCAQIFHKYGDFCGILIDKELLLTKWYPNLVKSGIIIANNLQSIGYVGHFDLDAVVDDAENIFLVEINARRTGGTHVHEFAHFFFGPNYLDQVVLLSDESLRIDHAVNYEELRAKIGDLLYPIGKQQRGIIITVTSSLVVGKFGCVIVAKSREEILGLRDKLEQLVNKGL